MPSRLVGGKVQPEPFPSIWRTKAIDVVKAQLEKGNMSVKALGRMPGGSLILAPAHWPTSVWTNLNTPQDVERFLAAP